MTTALQIGDFTSTIVEVKNANGSANSATLSISSGNEFALRVRVNPANPREVGALALSITSGANATVAVEIGMNSYSKQELFVVTESGPNQEGLTLGAWSTPTQSPPDWML